ncbi:polyphosphate kinase 2 family protein [Chamaesiphon minutus]|uniref:Polyphosphate:nucleotide phosphotransferase, PPK2 family n=1 Tax=Chamaesiphon minutus (strain ATCC 27169 / PCC 6605) TaxID=1173020 RepID=K9UJA3_CHAP6|nr:polyphosphate kinase 2 family protein [Chamaesiphon minutus]AFY94738.1 polyphosphate:nucleotide phosphotransferase, PPK2 family [Chamaesiphon minutus PCC 6605]
MTISHLNPSIVRHTIVPPGKKIDLKDYDPADTDNFESKEAAQIELAAGIQQLAEYQNILYAQNKFSVLIIFQAMDAAGKDSTIKHVMSGINPQGCQVYSFKSPSAEELDHDYLWRTYKALPERGRIGIFNRSYYEEALIVRVHPELLAAQNLPHIDLKQIWPQRFQEINDFERYLTNNGTVILKFFLHVSKKEQKKRFLERINEPEKHWKFSAQDIQERAYWDDYQAAYTDIFNHTSTEVAPWYIIPADRKWFMRLAVSDIICNRLQQMELAYPKISENQLAQLAIAKKMLEQEE